MQFILCCRKLFIALYCGWLIAKMHRTEATYVCVRLVVPSIFSHNVIKGILREAKKLSSGSPNEIRLPHLVVPTIDCCMCCVIYKNFYYNFCSSRWWEQRKMPPLVFFVVVTRPNWICHENWWCSLCSREKKLWKRDGCFFPVWLRLKKGFHVVKSEEERSAMHFRLWGNLAVSMCNATIRRASSRAPQVLWKSSTR